MNANPDDQPRHSEEFESEKGAAMSSDGFVLSDPVQSFVETTRAVILQPGSFFSTALRQGNLLGAVVFALICAMVSAIINLFSEVGMSLDSFIVVLYVATLIVTPLLAAILLLIGAFLLHVIVAVLANSGKLSWNSGFGATLKVAAYACVTGLVYWIPFIGPLLSLYSIYIIVVGIRKIHSRS